MTDLLVSWPGGSLESTLRLGGLILLSYALILWLSAVVWVYRDVRNRTNDQASQLIAVVLVAVFNVPGLIVYLVVRPQETLGEPFERSLESEAMLHELQLLASACQNCRRPVEDDYNVCPHCRLVLREACRSCSRPIRTNWAACPYCATERYVPRPQPIESSPEAGDGVRAAPRRPAGGQAQRRPRPAEATASEWDGQALPRRPASPQQIDS